MPHQPALERLSRALIATASQPREAVRESHFVPHAQETGPKKAAGKVKRSRKRTRVDSRHDAVGVEEKHLTLAAKQCIDPDPTAEVREIRAARHANVLTIVH